MADLQAQGRHGELARELDKITIESATAVLPGVSGGSYYPAIKVTSEIVAALHGLLPEGVRFPSGYYLMQGGIKSVTYPRDVETHTWITRNLIIPVGRGQDAEGQATIRIAYRHAGIVRIVDAPWEACTAEKDDKFVAATGSRQLLIEKGWTTFCRAMLAKNQHLMPERHTARVLGWQPDGTFIPATLDNERIVLIPAFPEQRQAALAHHAKGSATRWSAAVAEIGNRAGARAALASAFAAPLLAPLGVDPFIVDVAGTTSTGKTTVARVAASVSMNPTDGGGGMASWAGTAYATELRTNVSQGVLVVLDESQKAKGNPEKIAQIAYQNGMGKQRGGNWASGLKLHTLTLSTGEQSIVDWVTDGGVAARVIPVRAAPFGANWSAEQAEKLTSAVSANFGHALPAFAEKLTAALGEENGLEELHGRYQRIVSALRSTAANPVAARLAGSLAVLALADTLACEWGIIPLGALTLVDWLHIAEGGVAEGAGTDKAVAAYDVIREFVVANPHRIQGLAPKSFEGAEQVPQGGWIGKNDGVNVALLPAALKAHLESRGIEMAAVRPGLLAHGFLLPGSGGKATRVLKVSGVDTRCLVFALPNLERDMPALAHARQVMMADPDDGWPTDDA